MPPKKNCIVKPLKSGGVSNIGTYSHNGMPCRNDRPEPRPKYKDAR